MVPFESLGTVSYLSSIVTMAVSAAILEILLPSCGDRSSTPLVTMAPGSLATGKLAQGRGVRESETSHELFW